MEKMNAVNWFELPVSDMDRAKKFYGTVFNVEFQHIPNPNMEVQAFPWVQGAPNSPGCLVKSDHYKPHSDGLMIYFSCNDCAEELGRVEAAGGKVMNPKMSIGEFGYVAHFFDTEGNRVGLHSRQ